MHSTDWRRAPCSACAARSAPAGPSTRRAAGTWSSSREGSASHHCAPRQRLDLNVEVTVDHAPATWRGHVGVVTTLIARAGFDAPDTIAFVCGPEVMMRFAIKALEDAGVEREAIYLSMERNMKCAVGFCGHCQFGPAFVCRDGPVLRYDGVADLLALKEF
jgi:NAD(P)H-flavin reductase